MPLIENKFYDSEKKNNLYSELASDSIVLTIVIKSDTIAELPEDLQNIATISSLEHFKIHDDNFTSASDSDQTIYEPEVPSDKILYYRDADSVAIGCISLIKWYQEETMR